MIINSRYHVASLVAVFLALGVGIIIGSVMVGESFMNNIVHKQENIVRRLESDYQNLKKEAKLTRDEISTLKKDVEYYKRYAQATLPYVIKGRLKGKKIVVMESGNAGIPGFFLDNLKLAGAEISLYSRQAGDPAANAAVGPVDAVILVNHRLSQEAGKTVKEAATVLPRPLNSRETRVYYVETDGEYTEARRVGLHENTFIIKSAEHVPSLVALILAIAEGGPGGQAKEAWGASH